MPTALVRQNFPISFEICPNCGLQGFYRYKGKAQLIRNRGWTGHPPGQRCKYCKHNVPETDTESYLDLYRK